jgi:hypothetical protein
MKTILYLGCWGTKIKEFSLCSGCENEVLDLTSNTDRNLAIFDYLDSFYGLLDHPLYNNIHTALFGVQEKFSQKGSSVFPLDKFSLMERFCVMHAKCGLFLRLKVEG